MVYLQIQTRCGRQHRRPHGHDDRRHRQGHANAAALAMSSPRNVKEASPTGTVKKGEVVRAVVGPHPATDPAR